MRKQIKPSTAILIIVVLISLAGMCFGVNYRIKTNQQQLKLRIQMLVVQQDVSKDMIIATLDPQGYSIGEINNALDYMNIDYNKEISDLKKKNPDLTASELSQLGFTESEINSLK